MSEEILKALMQLFAIVTKQDEGVTLKEKEYVISFLKSQLNQKQVAIYNQLYEDYLIGKDGKSQARKAAKRSSRKESADISLEDLKKNPLLSMSDEQLTEDDKKAKSRLERKIRREEAKLKESQKANNSSGTEGVETNLTSVKDSVRTLSICKKINKTLSQPQKIVVLVRLFELIKSDNQFSAQRMAIIDTVSEVFNFDEEEFKSVQNFVVSEAISDCSTSNLLIINNQEKADSEVNKHIQTVNLDGNILILKVDSVDLYFMRYVGRSELNFNGLIVDSKRIYLFAPGSTIRLPKDKAVYYSDVVARFLSDSDASKISVDVENLGFNFPNGNIGLRDVNLSEEHGKLIGIMGASGAGKTTLLNVLCGIERPSEGTVKINGIDIHQNSEEVEGVIGYIPQDDLLLEDLTVYQNLFYNAKLCFAKKSDEEIDKLVLSTLNNLGLLSTKDLKVGNPLQKTISGGQRKRLNIGLELIREPSVLFVDEPTSGLSSRDSENVMDLLRELTLKGKVIFVVIHQPSSDIYKMFDKIFILDTGGYPIYYGNPVEAVIYFKKLDEQVNADQGECSTCGNVDVELIFNIIESQVVDEYGRYTGIRKVEPEKWFEFYHQRIELESVEIQDDKPEGSLDLPVKLKQWVIFTTRDVLSKLANRQYLTINLLEAPALALLLAFLIRFVDNDGGDYVYGKNENIPAFIFISIIVALFMGLTVSAEEIVKDQRILKRESFLNLSRASYFFSKMGILFTVSAIQTFSFVLIGNWVLGIEEMLLDTWLMLFTVSCFANMLGLNISATFNSAITIYILIPILLIPQMVLSGAIFSFEKLNEFIGSDDEVPFVADLMVSRWAFEAIAVNQFKNNYFEKVFYEQERLESKSDFKQVYYIPKLKEKVEYAMEFIVFKDGDERDNAHSRLQKLDARLDSVEDYFSADFEFEKDLHPSSVLVSDFSQIRNSLGNLLNQINSDSKSAVQFMNRLYKDLNFCEEYFLFESEEQREKLMDYMDLLKTEIDKQNKELNIYTFEDLHLLEVDSLHWALFEELRIYLDDVKYEYSKMFADANGSLSDMRFVLQDGIERKKQYRRVKNKYHNEELAMLVKKSASKRRIKQKNRQLIQVIDPIYRLPSKDRFWWNYRSHFFAPKKRFMNTYIETYYFNLFVIWVLSIVLYLTLYFGTLKWLIEYSGAAAESLWNRYCAEYFLNAENLVESYFISIKESLEGYVLTLKSRISGLGKKE